MDELGNGHSVNDSFSHNKFQIIKLRVQLKLLIFLNAITVRVGCTSLSNEVRNIVSHHRLTLIIKIERFHRQSSIVFKQFFLSLKHKSFYSGTVYESMVCSVHKSTRPTFYFHISTINLSFSNWFKLCSNPEPNIRFMFYKSIKYYRNDRRFKFTQKQFILVELYVVQ